MAQFCVIALAPVHGLESGGTCWGESAEGDTQGDPAASMRFCVALQPSLRRLDAACNTRGCGDDVAATSRTHTSWTPTLSPFLLFTHSFDFLRSEHFLEAQLSREESRSAGNGISSYDPLVVLHYHHLEVCPRKVKVQIFVSPIAPPPPVIHTEI